jgi:formylglycine-generating enzyme required for sulfatase activity
MADIFISYAHEDETRIRELVHALAEGGWSVFWDRRIPAGKTWQSYIGQALNEAKCVIVAWSHHSISSDWVIEEANDAKERDLLIPVLLDSVKPPLGFRGIQAADLTAWKPGQSSPYFDQLIQDIPGVLGGKPPRPSPEERLPARAQPVAIPRKIPTEPPPLEPAPPKPEPPPWWKKRNNFLTGVIIASAIAIVVGLALWASREPTRPIEPPVAKAPEPRPKTPPEVKTPEPVALPPKPAAKDPTQRIFTNSIGMSFVLLPAGSFTMGSPAGESGRNTGERQRPVTISKPFYLQTTEVTQKQWTQVMGSNPSYFTSFGDDCPVENVSWNDAQEFIKKLNQKESGAKYRLPSEAEWEYACRAGSKGRFCFGDEEARLKEYAWYKGNSGDKTHPVGKRKPNAWGLYDMHGNVWEWVEDDWQEGYKEAPDDGSAWIDNPRASGRVVRGGGWGHVAPDCRSASRNGHGPDPRGDFVAFRITRSVAPC